MVFSYHPDIAIHPGETLDETLEFLGMSQVDLSKRTGLTEQHISRVVSGKASITPETAMKLERVLDVKAEFWTNLQSKYDNMMVRSESKERLSEEAEYAKKFSCYSELVGLGVVEKVAPRDISRKIENLLRFFRVDSLRFVSEVDGYGVAFRNMKGEVNQESLAAWLRYGELKAEAVEVVDFDKKALRGALAEVKKLFSLSEGFDERLKAILSRCGVVVVYAPYFKGTKINGATRWINDKPVIQLNTKGAYADIFWFTLFHEIGHLLLHGKKDQFLELPKKGCDDEKEREADEFAKEELIPSEIYEKLVAKELTPKEAGIDEDIFMGRMAHDGRITWKTARGRTRKRLVFVGNTQ